MLNRSQKWGAPIVAAPEGGHDEFVAPYVRRAQPDQVGLILKAREPARILGSIGSQATNRYHLELKRRGVDHYNFYLNDRRFGPMFVRGCPSLPFSARLCLNPHEWLALRLRERGIRFTQCANAFLRCRAPAVLQRLADALTPEDLIACGQKWLATRVPCFTARERRVCQPRLFFAQVEHCDHLSFRRRAPLAALGDRRLDANRASGQPQKLTLIFGRKITRRPAGKLHPPIAALNLGSPVSRSHYQHGSSKQYVRDRRRLRTEPATNHVTDYDLGTAVEPLPALRTRLQGLAEASLDVQPDILETCLDRGQLRPLAQPTVTARGKRVPGLKLEHPRPLAGMHAVVRFAHLAPGSFTTADLHPHAAKALGVPPPELSLGSLRSERSKLRVKGLLERLPPSRRSRLLPPGYRLCVVYLTLFEKSYAPLTAGLLRPFPGDAKLPIEQLTRPDTLYRTVVTARDDLVDAVGLKAA